MSRVTSGVLLACYSPISRSPVSPVAIARIHTLLTDMFDVPHVCLSSWVCAALGSRLAMSARVLCHMDASDTIIYVSQKAQSVPGQVRWHPWEYRA